MTRYNKDLTAKRALTLRKIERNGELVISTVTDPVVLDNGICNVEDLFVDGSHVILLVQIYFEDEYLVFDRHCVQV